MRKILIALWICMVTCCCISCGQKIEDYVEHQVEIAVETETESEAETETEPETIAALIIESETEPETEASTNPYSKIFDEMTDEEYWLLCKVAQAEAGISSDECMIAVVETVLNRVLDSSNRFNNTIKGVLYQKGEFSTAKYLADTVVTDRAIDAVEYVIEHGNTLLDLDYVYFCTKRMDYSTEHIYIGYPDGVGHYYGKAK